VHAAEVHASNGSIAKAAGSTSDQLGGSIASGAFVFASTKRNVASMGGATSRAIGRAARRTARTQFRPKASIVMR